MSAPLLQLVFDSSCEVREGPGFLTVLCNESGLIDGVSGLSRRDFYAEGYEEEGRKACLWWYRQFSETNSSGLCLHDLFAWDRQSALWFSDVMVLYPESGTFPRLMIAMRALDLFTQGRISGVRIVGNEKAFEAVFQRNHVPCELCSMSPSTEISPFRSHSDPLRDGEEARNFPSLWHRVAVNAVRHLVNAIADFYRWFIEGRLLRLRYLRQHRANQANTLLYSAHLNEWQIPGDGAHRYHGNTLHEILEARVVEEVRPVFFAAPPGKDLQLVWRISLKHALSKMKGVHALAFSSLSVALRALFWSRRASIRLEEWLRNQPDGFGRWKSWDLRELILPVLLRAPSIVAPLLIRYEAVKKAFNWIHPRALLLKDEVYADGRLLVAAAQAAGVRTVSIQHGTIYPSHWCYVMDCEAQGISRPPLPEVFGVYGPEVSQLLTEWSGFPAEILCVIGARRFRLLAKKEPSREVLAFAGKQKVILLAGQMHQEMPILYDWCFEAARSRPDMRFVVKPHPRDLQRVESIRARCELLPNTLFFQGPIADVLPAAQAVVSGHSTVLLEAIWMGVPAISVQVSKEQAADWQTRAGILRIVRNKEDLLACLDAAAMGILFKAEDLAKASSYLEEYLGYSVCADSKALVELFS